VDNDPAERAALAGHLRRAGYGVMEASDGRDALHLASSHRFDLIVLDARLPRLDALATLRGLRGLPAAASVPVVLLSAGAGDAVDPPVDLLDSDMLRLLREPFGPQELTAAIAGVLVEGLGDAVPARRIDRTTTGLRRHWDGSNGGALVGGDANAEEGLLSGGAHPQGAVR
jgi:DNA-binding response OmpR family regulator